MSATALALTACHSREKVLYFQDMVVDTPEVAQAPQYIRIEPGDKLSIIVSSSDPQVASVFNLIAMDRGAGLTTQSGGNRKSGGGSSNNGLGLYTVNDRGNIDFPILGELHISGLTRQEASEFIKKKLIDGKYVTDPVVTVEFANLHFSIIGDTGSSMYSISDDQINIIEALAMAGDLNITAERDQIYVIRTENGLRTTTRVDMRTKDIFNSPVYYLKQNDIIYVVPNGKKTGEYSINENQWKNPFIYATAFTTIIGIATLVVSLTK
ncbi:MAG: polysaccharide biosynthesis/export family protein [Candidatus Amulumruptor sp.]